MSSYGRNPFYHCIIRDIIDNNSTSCDYGIFANFNPMNNCCSCTYKCTFTDITTTRNYSTRAYMDTTPDIAVMINNSSCIDNGILPNATISLDNCTCHNLDTIRNPA